MDLFLQIALIFSVILRQGISTLTLPAFYLNAILNETSKINLTQNLTLNNSAGTTYKWLRVNDFYIQRINSVGKLQLYDLQTNVLKYNIFLSNYAPTSSPIRYYVIGQNSNQSLATCLQDRSFYVSTIKNNGSATRFYEVVDGSTVQKYALGLTAKEFLTLEFTNWANYTYVWRRIKMPSNYYVLTYYWSKFSVPVFNMKTCQPPNNTVEYLFAIWKSYCFVQIVKCQIQAYNCSLIYYDNSTACNSSQYTSNTRDFSFFQWNSDCTKIIYQSKHLGIKVVSLYDTSSNIVLFPYSNFNTPITGFWFVDDYEQFVGIAMGRKFQIYNVSLPYSRVYEYQFLFSYELITYSKLKRTLLVSSGENLFSYNFQCQLSNYEFLMTGICNRTYAQNSTNSTNGSSSSNNNNTNSSNFSSNTTNNNSQSNYSLNTSNNSAQTTNKTESNITNLTSNQSKYKYEDQIGSMISNSFLVINKIASSTISFLQIFPYSFLFMRFINFWSICSMYIFPGFTFPSYLNSILFKIYQDINASIFSMFSLNLPAINLNIEEKFTQNQIQSFSLSSDVFNSNIQNFLILMLSYAILVFLLMLQQKLPAHNFIKKKLQKMNFKLAFIAQYISIMNTFIFSFPILTSRSYQSSFIEKINLLTQNSLFCFSAFVPALTLIVLKKSKQKKQQYKQQRLNWFFDCMCNSLLPLVTIIRNAPLFLIFNIAFFCIPIYVAWRQKECRIICLVKSSYFTLFNFGVILLSIFEEKYYPATFHHVSIGLMIIIFVGAIHELLELFITILREIFISLRTLFRSFAVKEDSLQKEKQTAFQQSKTKNTRRNGVVKFPRIGKIGANRQSKNFQYVKYFMLTKDTDANNLQKIEQKDEENKIPIKNRKTKEKVIVQSINPNHENQSKISFLKRHVKTSF